MANNKEKIRYFLVAFIDLVKIFLLYYFATLALNFITSKFDLPWLIYGHILLYILTFILMGISGRKLALKIDTKLAKNNLDKNT